MKKLFQIALMFVFAAFCSCSSDSEETVIYRIFFSAATEGFMGSTDSEAYSVYSSIKSGIVEFEKKYCGEWSDVVKEGDYDSSDKSASSKFEEVTNYFKNFEIAANDKLANLPSTGSNEFKFAGKLVITRLSSKGEGEQFLNSYSYSFDFGNNKEL